MLQVQVNRAPVITLWAAVVAQRQGHSRDAALTFGKYISGMLAQSKGRSIGIYEDDSKSEEEKSEAKRNEEQAGVQRVDVFGMFVKAVKVRLLCCSVGSCNYVSSAMISPDCIGHDLTHV